MTSYAVEIDTTAERGLVAERSAALAQDVFASLGRALLDRLGRGDPIPEEPAAARGEGGTPGAVVGVAVTDTGSGPRIQRWRPDVVDRQLRRLAKGDLESLSLGYTVLDGRGFAHGPSFGVDISLFAEGEGLAAAFAVRLSESWPAAGELFEDWVVPFFERGVASLDADSGFVTLDAAGDSGATPYEKWCGWGFAQGLEDTATTLRGYYWANFLTAGHLERIGGADAIRAAVPGASVEPLGHGVLVRLPGTPSSVAWADRRALYDVLKPLLLEPRAGYSAFPPGQG